MSSKKKSPKRPSGHVLNKPYSPRPGSVPGWIYKNLAERPMLFGELSVHVGRATGMSGDNLASQLSAALRDLVIRGAVVRLRKDTNRPVPNSAKNARGALYSLVPSARSAYLKGERKEPSRDGSREVFGPVPAPIPTVGAGATEPGQRDLSAFVLRTGPAEAERPARMTEGMFAELKRAKSAARAQIAAIEMILKDPAWA